MEFIDKLLKLTTPQELGYVGIFEFLIQFHILFGLISLITGTAILARRKGDGTHRKVGRVFVAVMLGNFLLGVPLGSAGQLVVGEPANLMTVIGALFVGTVTYSGYRLAKAGMQARAWHDKAMLGLQIVTGAAYMYLALLMIVGTSLFGISALRLEDAQQFFFADNRYPFFEQMVPIVGTTDGTVFAFIASENFLTPLFLAVLTGWFAVQDWRRINGRSRIGRPQIIYQHLTRLLVAYSAAISAVLLNTGWVSYAVCWTLPIACALPLALYYWTALSRRQGVQERKAATAPA